MTQQQWFQAATATAATRMSLLSVKSEADQTFRFQQLSTHLMYTFIHQASKDVHFFGINIFKD